MRNFRLLLIICLFGLVQIPTAWASCLPSGFTFTSQAQIDAFPTNYPGCTEIDGDVTIQGAGITNLNGLSSVTTFNGALKIRQNGALTNLSGLENVTTVGKGLWLYFNASLNDISSLSNLTTVGFELHIYFNGSLTSLSGLDNLTSVGGYCTIDSNTQLTDFSGLDNLASVGLTLKIQANTQLTSLMGLGSLTTIGTDCLIQSNNLLTDFTGLDNLATIGGVFTIKQNAGLTSLAGLFYLNYIGSYIKIDNNDALETLIGLNGLFSLGGGIIIENNDKLNNITSLENVTSVNGFLRLRNNDVLCSLAGLDNIAYNTITGLTITTSAILSTCDIPSICNYLNTGGSSSISGNISGCNSSTEIQSGCSAGYPEADVTGNSVTIIDGSLTTSTADLTDFGNVDISAGPVTHSFIIENTGSDDLKIFTADIDGPDVADFSLIGLPNASNIAAGSTMNFDIIFNPTTTGNKVIFLAIANSDSDESIYTFMIEGNGTNCTATTCTSNSPLQHIPGTYDSYISQTDGTGWTHYCSCEGKLLLSLDIGTTGAVINDDEVTVQIGPSPIHYPQNTGFITNPDGVAMIDRRWEVNPTTQPTGEVGVRFYYTTPELNAMNNLLTSMDPSWGIVTVDEMNFYKVTNSALGEFPAIASVSETDVIVLTNAATPPVASTTSWMAGNHGGNDHYAEFKVTAFSGGGGGAGGGSTGVGFLPVELIYFQALSNGEKVNLGWATETESNNEGFKIERSSNGYEFEEIGFVRSNSNTVQFSNYHFVDEEPHIGQNYYRLKITDFDGYFEYSSVQYVFFAEEGTITNYYPNPTKKGADAYLDVEVEKEAFVQWKIFNTTGKLIRQSQQTIGAGLNTIILPLNNFTAGMYFLEVEVDGLVQQHKMIITER